MRRLRSSCGVLALLALLAAVPASAQNFKVSPSIPLGLVMPGAVHPVQLAPGAGIQAGWGFLNDNLSLDLGLFGGISTEQAVIGQLGLAAFACFAHYGCAGPFMRIAATQGGLFGGHFDAKNDVGIVFSLAFDMLNLLQVGHGVLTVPLAP